MAGTESRARRSAGDTRSRSNGSSGDGPRRARKAGSGRRGGLGSALGWTALGTVVPGAGLLRGGRRVSGLIALILFLAGLGGVAYLALAPGQALTLLTDISVLRFASLGLVGLGLAWAGLTVATYWSLAPQRLSGAGRGLAAVVVALLAFAVTAPSLVGAQYALSSAQVLSTVFRQGQGSVTVPTFAPGDNGDPWGNKPRLNVLFLGYDRGIGRTEDTGGLTDTIMLASIDTASGNTVLVSVPRETAKMPFPDDSPLSQEFDGCGWYDCYNPLNPAFYLNSMYLTLPMYVDPDIIGPTSDLGADAMKLSVGEALGQKIDYYVLVNIDGATDLVDAIGGITVNINKELPKEPIELGYFEPGPDQHLNGGDALQYARSRKYDDDFQRNGRQRCVVKAILDQADPAILLTRYEAIAAASSDMIRTDIPATLIAPLFDLVLKVKQQGVISGLGFVDGYGFMQTNPDFQLMAERVAQAIAESTATASVDPNQSADPGAADPGVTDPGAETSLDSVTALSVNQNLDDFCAYHPE
ncbi:MAG: LCP family protein [Propionibacteriaceae bacterium]|jgi:LCP family protein required for cell wall assembly|nr:LCP family protein [Propionibacteriaceae bacterium]